MLRKPWKVFGNEKGKIEIFGNNHPILLEDKIPDWNDEEEPCFTYKGNTLFLSQFESTHQLGFDNALQEFQGISHDTYFSGLLIKFGEDMDHVLVYTFITS